MGTLLEIERTLWEKDALWYQVQYNGQRGYIRADMAEQLTVRELQAYLEERDEASGQAEWETWSDNWDENPADRDEEDAVVELQITEEGQRPSIIQWLLRKLLPSYAASTPAPVRIQYQYTLLADGTARITGYSLPDGDLLSGETGLALTVAETVNGHPVREIGPEAFAFSDELESVRIPKGIVRVGVGAFRGCSFLREISLPEGLLEIGAYAFQDCAIEKAALPNGLRVIERGAFAWCSALTSAEIPASVEFVGDTAFMGCRKLAECAIQGMGTIIGKDAFTGCLHLQMTVPWGSRAEQYCLENGIGCTYPGEDDLR